MPTTVDEVREALLHEARNRGCTLKENINFWRVDGRHSTKRFNVGKTGTKVTLSGFCIATPGVMPISEEDAHDLRIGGTRGIFDFMAPNAREIIQGIWREILADKRD
jgi:hypothetical protein